MLEVKRQCVHALGVFIILLIQIFGKWIASLLLFFSLVFLFIFAEYRKRKHLFRISRPLEEIESIVENEIKSYERPYELPFKGAITFLLGSFLSVLIFKPYASIAAIAVLALADSISTLVGYYFGKHKLPINKKKTWEGSFAFLIVALVILSFFTLPLNAVLVAIIATLVEMLPKIDDNLTIPLIVGFFVSIS